MPLYPLDPVVVSKARQLASDLDQNAFEIADRLAEQGHHGPDGNPYPIRTIGGLLDEDMKRQRVERYRERNAAAIAAWSQWTSDHSPPSAVDGAAALDPAQFASDAPAGWRVVASECCAAEDDFPLTPAECWLVMRGFMVRPNQPISVDEFHKIRGSLELLDGYVRLNRR
jgi:hypothetical protein